MSLSGVHLGTNAGLGDVHAGGCSATAVLCLLILSSAAQHCSDRRGAGLGSGGRTPVWEMLQRFETNLVLIWTADSAALLSIDCDVVAQASQVAGFLAPLASHGVYFTHGST